MEHIEKIWNTGAASPFDLDNDLVDAFKESTGSTGVVGLRWRYGGRIHELGTYAVVLPDKSGAATTSKWNGKGANWMDVVNADGSLRFRFRPPPLSERLDHTHAKLESPRPGWPSSGIAFGVQASYRDKAASAPMSAGEGVASVGLLLDIDWENGDLKDWKVIPPYG
jgi:hypothetical protein